MYDANGNLTGDSRDGDNVKQDMKYDYRNLLTEMRLAVKSGDSHSNTTQIYQLKFDYDEAGNRVRKREYLYQGQDPSPIFNNDNISKDSTQGNVGTGDGNGTTGNGGTVTSTWRLVSDEYYSRDVSGKEIAVYHSYDLDHWNVWGTDNVGKINANGSKFFYIKDHLGSVRVVLNSDNQIVSAIDYDCWGYPLENRSYQSDGVNYKFTGKQRDAETGYDYFGARYYDARIGRWGGVEPLLEKYISYSPYQYGLLNPIKLVDANGLDVYITGQDSKKTVEYMNQEKNRTGLMISINNSGKLSVTGKPLTEDAKILYNAITNDEYTTVLITKRSDIVQHLDGSTGYMNVGTYEGSFKLDKGTVAIQYFNLPQAVAYHKAGGSTVAISAFHEIKEGFIGAVLYPGTGVQEYSASHTLSEATDPRGLKDPGQRLDEDKNLYYLKINGDYTNEKDHCYPAYDSNK